MRFTFMKNHAKEFCIEKMAKILGVSCSGYYKYLNRPSSIRQMENMRLLGEIQKAYKKGRRMYGSPRIHRELKKNGETCSRKRIAKIMRQEKIQAKTRKHWKVTTKSNPKAKVAPHRLQQNFSVEVPNKIWVSDITYIETLEGWLYVTVVLDLFSRKAVGLSMGASLETGLVVRALEQALCHRKFSGSLIHHSDKGCQYTSKEFLKFTQAHRIELSMSGKGNCYDNAVAESFFHTLKTEHTNHYKFKTREEAMTSIFEYVEVFYNRQRLHSSLGYLSPDEYERGKKSKEVA
ncbi:MAG: IS3 family transposase [Chlamydiae bacterium]|nr:IS3 family transposase [Chlamydiota bacterium]